MITVALAGDTMLGRGVAEALERASPESLVAPEVAAAFAEADLAILNLECCVSERGDPWPDPRKPFFFRAPPAAVGLLRHLGVDCVTLANNHALDYGAEALVDTFEHLVAAGIAWAGAGRDLAEARRPAVLEARGFRLAVVCASDHPPDFAAGPGTPGIAYSPLDDPLEPWLREAIHEAPADAVLVSPHWGPNMTPAPVARVRRAARAFVAAGATLVAGHSAHVFHGVEGRVLFDLGDFLDDYARHPVLRNELGLLFVVRLDADGPRRVEALPLRLDYARTGVAEGRDAVWIERRLRALGTPVRRGRGRFLLGERG